MLKQVSLSVFAFMAICITSYAQQPNAPADAPIPSPSFPQMEFGVHAGPGVGIFYNQHPLKSPRNPNKPPLNVPVFGIAYQYNFTRMIGLHVEANYERKGDVWYDNGAFSYGGNYIHSYAFDQLNYLSIPVTLRLSFGKYIKFFTNTGVYTGVLISGYRVENDANFVGGEIPLIVQTRRVTDVTRDLHKVDAGLVTGLGVSFPLGKIAAFTFEARNNLGFVNLQRTDRYLGKFYNNSTSFLFGLSLNLVDAPKPTPLPAY